MLQEQKAGEAADVAGARHQSMHTFLFHELLKESSDSLHVPAAPGTWHLVIEQE